MLPIPFLLINLVTEGFPAIAFGLETSYFGVMPRRNREPQRTSHHTIAGDRDRARRIMVIATLSVLAVSYYSDRDAIRSRAIAFTALMLLQLFLILSVRSETVNLFVERFGRIPSSTTLSQFQSACSFK